MTNLIIALTTLLPYTIFRVLGGRDFDALGIRARIWKRVISPVWLSVGILTLTIIHHQNLLGAILASSAYFGQGFIERAGKDELWKKILWRTVSSLSKSGCALFIALPNHHMSLFAVQLTVGLLTSLLLGVNSILPAPLEEGSISLASVLLVPLFI